MLSESVLEELARDTAFREHLVTTAWPNLSVESRLQLIELIQGLRPPSLETPAWLAKLAIDDAAPIVRYWAARHTYFRNKGPEHYSDEISMSWAATEEDKALYAKAAADPCELVRFCVPDHFNYKALTGISQLGRLAFIRALDMPDLLAFTEWLEAAIPAGVVDRDLSECANEFFMHPRVKCDMKRKYHDFWDGYDWYKCGEGMKKGWALTKVASPRLRDTLSWALPTSYGSGTMKVDDLAQLPDEVLENFFYRADKNTEIEGVLKLMHDHPERFSAELIAKFKERDPVEPARPTPEEIEERRSQEAVERHAETLDSVMAVKQQLAGLPEYFQGFQEATMSLRTRMQGGFKSLLWAVAGIAILLLLLKWTG
jgi:hypothetical protein